jgi:hypothetical protein
VRRWPSGWCSSDRKGLRDAYLPDAPIPLPLPRRRDASGRRSARRRTFKVARWLAKTSRTDSACESSQHTIHPTRRVSGWEYAVPETMAAGLPVVGFRDHPLLDMVPLSLRVLADTSDAPALASAIRNSLHNPASLSRISRSAGRCVSNEFTWIAQPRVWRKSTARSQSTHEPPK